MLCNYVVQRSCLTSPGQVRFVHRNHLQFFLLANRDRIIIITLKCVNKHSI